MHDRPERVGREGLLTDTGLGRTMLVTEETRDAACLAGHARIELNHILTEILKEKMDYPPRFFVGAE